LYSREITIEYKIFLDIFIYMKTIYEVMGEMSVLSVNYMIKNLKRI